MKVLKFGETLTPVLTFEQMAAVEGVYALREMAKPTPAPAPAPTSEE